MNNDRCHGNLRSLLRQEWTALNKLHRYQPLDYIKDYFGVKIALYFAWLGFYTHTLLFASVVGCLCFFYSVLSLPTHIPSKEICSGTFNVTMCPICDHSGEHSCGYWYLGETCLHSKAAYLFDNSTTVFFAMFMSLWAALFLETWKRYSAEITHRWDLTGFDHQEEHPRPQYFARLAHITTKRVRDIISLCYYLIELTIVHLFAGECCDSDVGASGAILAKQVPCRPPVRFADLIPRLSGPCGSLWCHSLPNVSSSIALYPPRQYGDDQRFTHHNSDGRFHQLVLHYALQPPLRTVRRVEFPAR